MHDSGSIPNDPPTPAEPALPVPEPTLDSPQLEPPPEEPAPMLDVHPAHHAASTWRDFFIHIATIVLGLCIAISLEQTVEYFHHRREVSETREALRLERDENIKAFATGMSEFNRQTAALENNLLVLHYIQQHPNAPADKLPGILLWHAIRTNLTDSAWKTAQQSNVTALMAQSEVRDLARLYQRIDAVAQGFDQLWPIIIQARLYSLADPDPSHLPPAEIAHEIELTRAALAAHFTQAAALVQLSAADPGFTPQLDREELNRIMRVSEAERDPRLAVAIALTNSRLPAESRLPIPTPHP